MMWLGYLLAGFCSGVISGMGIGGGAVLIPALSFFFSVGQREAQHVNLLCFLPTAAVALCIHVKKGNVETKGLLRLTLFGLAGAAAGVTAALWLDAEWLRKGFGLFLLGMGVREGYHFFVKRKEKRVHRCRSERSEEPKR